MLITIPGMNNVSYKIGDQQAKTFFIYRQVMHAVFVRDSASSQSFVKHSLFGRLQIIEITPTPRKPKRRHSLYDAAPVVISKGNLEV